MFKNKEKIFIIGLFVVLGFFILHQSVLAATFTPQVGIPGSNKYQPGETVGVGPETFADYLTTFYNWAVGAIIVIGIVMIMFAGFQWVMAAGSAPKISAAKERIFSAIIGILLAVGSYALLNFINPSLTRFRSLSLNPVTEVGRLCTIYIKDDGECIEAGEKYKAYRDNTALPDGYVACRGERGCPGATSICCAKNKPPNSGRCLGVPSICTYMSTIGYDTVPVEECNCQGSLRMKYSMGENRFSIIEHKVTSKDDCGTFGSRNAETFFGIKCPGEAETCVVDYNCPEFFPEFKPGQKDPPFEYTCSKCQFVPVSKKK